MSPNATSAHSWAQPSWVDSPHAFYFPGSYLEAPEPTAPCISTSGMRLQLCSTVSPYWAESRERFREKSQTRGKNPGHSKGLGTLKVGMEKPPWAGGSA